MRRENYRYQRTIGRPVEVHGVGFLTGALVRLCFRPAPANAGIIFVRTDLPSFPRLPARLDQVTGTERRTTLGRPPIQVGLVEHVLAALAGLRIDNCYVDLNAPEPPGLDGSALEFVKALRRAGAVLQPAARTLVSVDTPVVVEHKGATLALHPASDPYLKISYFLDYGWQSPIVRQLHTQQITPTNFASDLADCRTFLLEQEAVELKKQGLGRRTSLTDLLVFGHQGPIGNRVRHGNEPARHKILDLVGDLSLLGYDLCGHLVGYRSGHQLNVALGRMLAASLAENPAARKRVA